MSGAAPAPADAVYRNGIVYTVDAHDSVQQALAVRAGRIVYVGSDAGLGAWVGPATRQIDLAGRVLMPGLVDGHMHPLMGGAALPEGVSRLRAARGRRDAGEDPGVPRCDRGRASRTGGSRS